jgi:ABC-2 type transport system permease protein
MQGIPITFFEDVWSRNFVNIFASPLRISEYLAGLIISSIETSFMWLVFMLIVASGGFGLSFFSYGSSLFQPFLPLRGLRLALQPRQWY